MSTAILTSLEPSSATLFILTFGSLFPVFLLQEYCKGYNNLDARTLYSQIVCLGVGESGFTIAQTWEVSSLRVKRWINKYMSSQLQKDAPACTFFQI